MCCTATELLSLPFAANPMAMILPSVQSSRIDRGAVAVRTPVGAGSQLQPGDFFGEMSLLDGEPRSATIVATTDVRLLIVDRSHFWRLLDEAPDLVRRILTILSRRVRRLEQTVHTIFRGTNPA